MLFNSFFNSTQCVSAQGDCIVTPLPYLNHLLLSALIGSTFAPSAH